MVRLRDGPARAVGLAHYAEPHDDPTGDIGAGTGDILHDPLHVDAGETDHGHATTDDDHTQAGHHPDRAGPDADADDASQAGHHHDRAATHHDHDGTPRGWLRFLSRWVARRKPRRPM
jgi:hypothetical protein